MKSIEFSELSVEEKKVYATGLVLRYPNGAKLKDLRKTIGSVDEIVAVLRWIRGYAQIENHRHGDDVASLPGLWVSGMDFIANGYFSNEDGSLGCTGYSDVLDHDIYHVVSKGDTISFQN